MSSIVSASGYVSGSHMRICGETVICETTATVGWSAWLMIAESVLTAPSVISGSTYMSAATDWNPTFGPPGRTSMSTPVSTPPATSEPVTDLFSASIV
jgi:hypothetical protein